MEAKHLARPTITNHNHELHRAEGGHLSRGVCGRSAEAVSGQEVAGDAAQGGDSAAAPLLFAVYFGNACFSFTNDNYSFVTSHKNSQSNVACYSFQRNKLIRPGMRQVFTEIRVLHLEWYPHFNSSITYENSSIMVPETGVYFVYVRFILGCYESNTNFRIKLERWNEGYTEYPNLMTAKWSLTCSSSHNVFIGELFELIKGDQLKVKVEEGCDVILESTFGTAIFALKKYFVII
uniref:THD domain-containing protein n=1 Tax=Oryzias latipes TaxID=8090 RepID=A0A3B3HYI4_ORYLA